MSGLDVYSKCQHVACVVRIPTIADGYSSATPWALLHNNGKVRTFGTQAEAKDEARKVYPSIRFNRRRG